MCVFSHIYQMELSSTLTGALYPLMFPLTLKNLKDFRIQCERVWCSGGGGLLVIGDVG